MRFQKNTSEKFPIIKKISGLLFFLITMSLAVGTAMAVNGSNDNVWREIDDSALRQRESQRIVTPDVYRTFRLNKNALQEILKSAPLEAESILMNSGTILTIPMPDGTFQRFAIKESPIMEAALAAKFPEIKTFMGQGIDDPTATTRFDMTPKGFRAIILSKDGTIYIEPYANGDTSNYVSFNKANLENDKNHFCLVSSKDTPIDFSSSTNKRFLDTPNIGGGGNLRTYRLAVATTGEYSVAVGGGTVGGTLAAIATTMNRVNGIYERELSVRLVLIGNNNLIVYTNGATDPYTNNNGDALIGENQTNVTNVIGTANFDIGHVFSTGGGGVATLESPCNPATKARGVTGSPNPQGDPFDVDFVAHEMGHQFGGEHTWNGTTGSCAPNDHSPMTAFEPASGSTIQAYAGICDPQDLQRNSNDYFHALSLEQMLTFVAGGGNCSMNTANGNTAPTVTVTGGTTYNIPRNTPFTLSASGTDANGDALTFDWEQYDLGPTGLPAGNILGPIFRSYSPTTSGSRTFPSLTYILNNANVPPATYTGTSPTGSVCRAGFTCITGEVLSSITRTMNFRVTVRDNRAGGGLTMITPATVNVAGGSGPFEITAPNTNVTWAGNSQQTVTWNVNNTNSAPVNAANVKISLSTNGGLTFPTTIVASTPNDGNATITVPNIATTQARIKVEAVGNIFFDINATNFTITANQAAVRSPFDFDGDNKTDISIFRPAPAEWWYLRSLDGGNRAFQFGVTSDTLVPADFTGDGKTDVAIFRQGTWFVLRSEDLSFYAFPFGTNGDIPVPADFDGDGKADAAVFRPSSSTWFISLSNGGTTIQQFGIAGDKPIPADYDGDGRADIAIYRPGPREWWIQRSQAGLIAYQFGATGDRVVPGDYTGDGKADVAIFRPANGNWFILRSEDLSFFAFPFGTNGDTPTPGDYDGDGRFDAGVFRPSSNTWFIQRSTAGTLIQTFGIAGDAPIPAVYGGP